MKGDEFLNVVHRERHAHGDADGPNGQKFDGALDADRTERADALHGRQADHLRLVEKKLARAALAGIHGELRHRLAEQFTDRLARGVISHVERIDVNDLAPVT